MKTSRTYVERRIAEVCRNRKTWRKPGRRALDRGHIHCARRQHRARITTRPWAGR